MPDLAPHHKIGLPLAGPVLIAAGFCGYGDAYQGWLDLSPFGGLVTAPITLRPERGTPQPRLVETRAGFILQTGDQNPGVRRVLNRYSQTWSRLGPAIIAHLPAAWPDDLRRTARALSTAAELSGFELGLPVDARPEELPAWIEAIRQGSELPLLLKLPLPVPFDLVEAALEAGVEALVIGAPPWGRAFSGRRGQWLSGPLYGPTLHSLALHDLHLLADLDLPLVAAGGIHTLAEAELLLQAGAAAVQLDSLLFVDPLRAQKIAEALADL